MIDHAQSAAPSPIDDESVSASLRWRTRALKIVLVVIAVTGLPAYLLPVVNALQTGHFTPLLWIYLGVYLVIIGLAGWPGPGFRARAWSLILVGYTNGIASFARLGMAGSGRLYLIVLPVLATTIIGARAGYLTAALSLVIYAAFTLLAQVGVLANWLTLQTNPVSLDYWLEAGAALAVFLIMIVVLLERFAALQSRTLAAKQQVSAQLTEAYQTLEQRVAERTQALATLNAIAAMVSRPLDLKEVMAAALDQTLQVVGMDGGVAYQLDDATQTLVMNLWC